MDRWGSAEFHAWCGDQEKMSTSDLDRQIETLRRCELITEEEVKGICAKAREILVEESNTQRVDSPVTVCFLKVSVYHHGDQTIFILGVIYSVLRRSLHCLLLARACFSA